MPFTPEFGVLFPVLAVWKKQKMFLPHPRVKVSIVESLRDREVACSASDRQGSNFESYVWRTVSSQSSHHPQEVLLAQFSLYVHKGGLKPDSFHFVTNTLNALLLHQIEEICSRLYYVKTQQDLKILIQFRLALRAQLQSFRAGTVYKGHILTYKDDPRTERVRCKHVIRLD